ncbi:unnamed protein product [Caenorhabditis brenneri]
MQNYTRTDYAQVGTTNRGCMRVIPADKDKDFDLIVVGGQNGSLICLSRKSNDTTIIFKTQPGPPIQSLALGGPASSKKKDKIFVASQNTVRGVNRKGKTFFSMETNMAEVANRMFVRGLDVVLTGRKSYSRYHDTVDSNNYLCTEDIHDVVSLVFEEAWGNRAYTSVLACGNSTLQVIEGNKFDYEVRLDSIPFTVALYMGDGGHTKVLVLYGTKTGRLGLASVPQGSGKVLWEISTTSTACVTTIVCYSVTGGQFPDIIVGKEDGLIEIYTIDETDHAQLFGTFPCEESITGISCGNVASKTETDIIVCTFTGWLFSLSKTSRPMIENLPVAANFNVKMQQLRSEVEELQVKVNEERTRYEQITKTQGGGAGSTFFHSFQVHESFDYSAPHGAYNLTIELVIPIDFVVVQSQLPIRLMEVEKNASVVSEVRQDALNPWPLLASYRCQANVCRLELRVQANEGDWGIINLYVCPKIMPKCAQITTHFIRALSSHQRTHDFDMYRPLNILQFTGTFSIAEAHAWLHHLLPNVPSKCPPADTITNNYACAANGGTQLQVVYSKGSAVFRSDCMSTISIIRDKVSEQTMKMQIRVEVVCELNHDSIDHCLKLIDPKLSEMLDIEKQKMFASALKELESNNDDVFSFLSPANAKLLRDHDEIYQKSEGINIEESGVLAVFENLALSRAKLTGKSTKGKVEAIRNLVENDYSLENMKALFKKMGNE